MSLTCFPLRKNPLSGSKRNHLNPINDFLLAQMLLGILAGIVVICLTGLAGAAISGHHLVAVATEQLGGQQILFLASASCRGSFVFVQNVLHPFKYFVTDNAWHTTRRFLAFVEVCADVAFVSQQAMQAVLIEVAPKGCFDLSGIQVFDDVSNSFALTIPLEDLADNDCFVLINIEGVIRSDLEAKAGIAAVRQALLRVERHTTVDLLRQLGGVVFRHTFQNAFHKNTGGIIGDILSCGDYRD